MTLSNSRFLTIVSLLSLFLGEMGLAQQNHDGTTLNQVIVKALTLDPSVRKGFSDVTEAGGYSREVRSDLLPQLRVEGSAGWAVRDRSIDGVASGGDNLFSRQVGLVFEQLLFDSGFHWFRWKDAEERLQAKRLLDSAQREVTAFGAVEAFLNVIRARKQIALAKANLDVHKKIKDLAAERVDAAGNQADVELSDARYNLAVTLVKERELALKQAETRLYRYTGQQVANLTSPSVPSVNSLEEIDPTQNFHYQAAMNQREAAALAKKAVESRYSPRFLFRGTGGLGEDVLGIRGQDNEASAMVVVQWDLFDSGRKKGLMEQAIADIDRQQAVIDETLVALNQDIESRWDDYSTIRERIAILADYAEKLTRTVALYEEQFELGTRPLLSMLDIKNEEIAASIRLVDERHDYDLNAYRLLFFGGRLITDTVGETYLATTKQEGTGDEYERHPWADTEKHSPATVAAQPEENRTDKAGSDAAKPKKRFDFFGIFKKQD